MGIVEPVRLRAGSDIRIAMPDAYWPRWRSTLSV